MEHRANKKILRIGSPVRILVVGLILLTPSGLLGRSWKPVDLYPSDNIVKIEMGKNQALLLADQHQSPSPASDSSTSREQSVSESKQEAESGKTPAKTQKKNRKKSFRPSERITADQAVDFPSDI